MLQRWLVGDLAAAWQSEHAVLEGRVDRVEAELARNLASLVKQGPRGSLYIRLPAGEGSTRDPWRLGTVWARLTPDDWVSDERLLADPVVRSSGGPDSRLARDTPAARKSRKAFRDAGGGR